MTKYSALVSKSILFSLVIGLSISSNLVGQTHSPDPFYQRPPNRDAFLAYLAGQRAKASVPVNYSFPVRSDLATAFNAPAYSPTYQFSRYTPSNYVYPTAVPQTVWRPTTSRYTSGSNPYAYSPASSGQTCRPISPSTTYSPGAAIRNGQQTPYYIGSSFSGPPKVYPQNEPIRNLFRYLIP